MLRPSAILVLLVVFVLGPVAVADEPPGSSLDPVADKAGPYTLRTSVLGSAGGPGTSPNFRTNGTLAQSTPIGLGSSASFDLSPGFWYALRNFDWLVAVPDEIPPRTALFQNFPNPFNPATTITYTVAEAGLVTVVVCDARGRRLRSLVHRDQPPGRYELPWDGRDEAGKPVAAGLYFCRFTVGDFHFVKKMMLLK